jgi:ABC-type molybdenum transport system ATPase subunit/photorepair protein PhrA
VCRPASGAHTAKNKEGRRHAASVGGVRAALHAHIGPRARVFDVWLGVVTASIGSVQLRHTRRRWAQQRLRLRAGLMEVEAIEERRA